MPGPGEIFPFGLIRIQFHIVVFAKRFPAYLPKIRPIPGIVATQPALNLRQLGWGDIVPVRDLMLQQLGQGFRR